MLKIEAFIATLAPEFDEADPHSLVPEMALKNIQGWSSMLSLIVVAKIKKVYQVNISSAELSQAITLKDLHELVVRKLEVIT